MSNLETLLENFQTLSVEELRIFHYLLLNTSSVAEEGEMYGPEPKAARLGRINSLFLKPLLDLIEEIVLTRSQQE